MMQKGKIVFQRKKRIFTSLLGLNIVIFILFVKLIPSRRVGPSAIVEFITILLQSFKGTKKDIKHLLLW